MSEKKTCFICKQTLGLGVTTRIMPDGRKVLVCGKRCENKKLRVFGEPYERRA